MLGFMFAFMLLVVVAIIFWLWMLVDVLTRKDKAFPGRNKGSERLIWVIVIVFLNIIGAALYYFLVRRK